MPECDIVNTRSSIKLNDLYLMNSLKNAAEMVIKQGKTSKQERRAKPAFFLSLLLKN